MYAMLRTRPDLEYYISVLSKFKAMPEAHHLAAPKRVLQYMKETKHLFLMIPRYLGYILLGS